MLVWVKAGVFSVFPVVHFRSTSTAKGAEPARSHVGCQYDAGGVLVCAHGVEEQVRPRTVRKLARCSREFIDRAYVVDTDLSERSIAQRWL